MNNWPTD